MFTRTIAAVFVDINEHKSQYFYCCCCCSYYFALLFTYTHINITSVNWDSKIITFNPKRRNQRLGQNQVGRPTTRISVIIIKIPAPTIATGPAHAAHQSNTLRDKQEEEHPFKSNQQWFGLHRSRIL